MSSGSPGCGQIQEFNTIADATDLFGRAKGRSVTGNAAGNGDPHRLRSEDSSHNADLPLIGAEVARWPNSVFIN